MLLTKLGLYNTLFLFIGSLFNSLKASLPIEISNLKDPVNKFSFDSQMNIWTMIVRPNILSQDIIVNASSQTEFLYQLEALFVYVFIIISLLILMIVWELKAVKLDLVFSPPKSNPNNFNHDPRLRIWTTWDLHQISRGHPPPTLKPM